MKRSDPAWVHHMKGKKFSPEISARMGRPKGFVSEKRGIPRTAEVKAKISKAVRAKALRGPACHSYKMGNLPNGGGHASLSNTRGGDVMSLSEIISLAKYANKEETESL